MGPAVSLSSLPLPDGVTSEVLLPDDPDGHLSRCFLSRQSNKSNLKRIVKVGYTFQVFDDPPDEVDHPGYSDASAPFKPMGVREVYERVERRAARMSKQEIEEYEPVDDDLATVADVFRALNSIWVARVRYHGPGTQTAELALQAARESLAKYKEWEHSFLACDEEDKEYCVVCGSGSSRGNNEIVFCPKCGCGRHQRCGGPSTVQTEWFCKGCAGEVARLRREGEPIQWRRPFEVHMVPVGSAS